MKADTHFNALEFLRNLITIETCDPPGREVDAARYIRNTLAASGIPAEIDEFLPGRANLLAKIVGAGEKPPLVFSAHLDTVPVGHQPWSVPPFSGEIREGRLFGRGASDMKSGVTAMAAAAARLASGGTSLAGDLILAFSAGESSNCLGAKRFVERGDIADAGAILVSEPSSLGIIVSEMGVLWLRAVAHGRLGHVSGNSGVNAIEAMSDFLRDLRTINLPSPEHALLPNPSICVGTISGGSAVNITPDRCEAEIDIRLRSGTDQKVIISILKDIAPPEIELIVSDFKPPVETAPDHPFVVTCMRALEVGSGAAPIPQGVAYYSDATIFNEAHGTPFAIIGPGDNGMSGQVDESVDLNNVEQAIEIYCRIAKSWLAS
ncbi:M20 family metallopeptidase [Pelagibius litoralis]|uniref:M20 family metallopeptidase n=2 Tax=Pelagibius litoralis TaxID=374515 RepID=A0A967F0R9_9PROT|nr:M20 family metallopeptidase [Pelagibius litoralis]